MTGEWAWQPIGQLLTLQPNKKVIQQGWSPRCLNHPATDGTWGVLKTTAIQAGRFEPEHNKELPSSLAARPHIEVRAGDLLMTCAGPRSRCGVPALVTATPQKLMMSGKMYRFRPDEQVDPRFLELYLQSPHAQQLIDKMKTGISDSGLNLTHGRFVSLPVPVPSLPEQRRIVEVLEDHLSHLDAAIQTVDRVSAQVGAWERSCIDRVLWSDERKAVFTPVRELLTEKMRNGFSGRASTSPGAVRSLTLTAVTENAFTEANTKLVDADDQRVRDLWLKDGDIFVQRSNTPQLVGTTAYYCGTDDWAIFPDLLIRLRADTARVTSQYLAAVLRSERAHRELRRRAKGLAGSMPKIDQRTIGDLRVPVPTRGLQEARAREVTAISEVAERLRRIGAETTHRSAALRHALLTAAFTGRLTGRSTDTEIVEELADAPA